MRPLDETAIRRARFTRGASSGAPACPTPSEREPECLSRLSICWIHPRGEGTWTLLDRRETTLGREPDSDVVLSGESTSRRHARISRRGAAYVIQDLGSRSGVYCDGMRVQEEALRPGRVLRIGDWVGVTTPAQAAGDVRVAEQIPGLLGSYRLRRALDKVRRAAESPAIELPVLLLGETGTGKELLARAFHAASGRPGRYVAVNCAEFAESLLEAQLFGHERGAFTGAHQARVGLVREADGGTLFLDEVGELSLTAQAKLLRVLNEREVLPVGGSRAIAVDLRVICATHRSLTRMIDDGTFRADLYARLEGMVVEVPPLRKRREDVLGLFEHFVVERLRRTRVACDGAGHAESAGVEISVPELTPRFVERLCSHAWPRNVRELARTADRLVLLHGGAPEWSERHLEDTLSAGPGHQSSRDAVLGAAPRRGPEEGPVVGAPRTQRARPSRRELLARLSSAGGNVTQAARDMGFSKETVYKLIRSHAVDLREVRARSERGSVEPPSSKPEPRTLP